MAVFQSDAERGVGAVEFEAGNGLRAEQLRGAVEINAGIGQRGVGRTKLGFEALLFLRTRTGLQPLQIRAGAGQLSLGVPKDSSMLCMVRAMADCIISLATRAWRRFVVPARSVRM